MKSLLQLRAEDPTVKSVVVSQFTSFLTLLETPLRCALILSHQLLTVSCADVMRRR